jgi:hypothetical protein
MLNIALLRYAIALVAINLIANVALLGAGYDPFIPWKTVAVVTVVAFVVVWARIAQTRGSRR